MSWAVKPRLDLSTLNAARLRQGDVSFLFTPPSAFSRQCKSPSSKREARDEDEGRTVVAFAEKPRLDLSTLNAARLRQRDVYFLFTSPSAFSRQCKSPSSNREARDDDEGGTEQKR
ncbi:hypothetical protein CDAR_506011 [Caerostris darwini]|uniref:Uncharacterized protein n=1 Tax=Caerostris darwini TaxID=1538125 RepID=A0AAV4WHT4_9ARAC|nr:hypothetical protein CDAR_506011 [Caerostris darwini]